MISLIDKNNYLYYRFVFMKSKVLIIIAAVALSVNIAVQVYLITGLYRLRNDAFDTKYQKNLNEGIESLRTYYNKNGFDSAFYKLDYTSIELLEKHTSLLYNTADDSLTREVLHVVKNILEQNDYLTPYLKAYLKVHKLDYEFKNKISIKQFVLKGPFEEVSVFNDSIPDVPGTQLYSGHRRVLVVNSFRMEGNYFSLNFSYLIDFRNKLRIIFREMVSALLLSIFSIFITGVIFFVTLRNMMRHKQLSMMKTDFINNMAHALKTPLTTIAVASSTLTDSSVQGDTSKVKELSALIKNQNQHLGRLIDYILDINLWERDRINLQKDRVILRSFFGKLLEGFRFENSDKEFKLSQNINLDNETMLLDEFQISIAIRNLLSNAIKYGGELPVIEFKAGVSGGELRIEISDNGNGIPEDEQIHIFDKFFRGQNSKQGIKGLGLGLYYVRKIVELHGGLVNVKSSDTTGTVFIVSIPL